MLVLFSDFGLSGPYTGQVKAVLTIEAPGVPVIDLFADAPACDPELSAYLLAAYAEALPKGSVFLCVVDPGVGTDRRPVALKADGRWFVGPDNGLFALLVRRAQGSEAFTIDWVPPRLSASFHGRDLFAPVAARLARGDGPPGGPIDPATLDRPEWPDDLARVVYIDVYGNAMTGLRAARLPKEAQLNGLTRARAFADVPAGEALWYENANGLAEIAVNRGRAEKGLGLAVGDALRLDRGTLDMGAQLNARTTSRKESA